MPNVTFDAASVKVMRSHDYCHFEVFLSSCDICSSVEDVDDLRKAAARLADKAVEQYKVAKLNAERHLGDEAKLENLRYRANQVLKIPQDQRTPGDKAIVKALRDLHHRNRPRYDYQEDWSEPDYGDDD